jgi:hypothetical protein
MYYWVVRLRLVDDAYIPRDVERGIDRKNDEQPDHKST